MYLKSSNYGNDKTCSYLKIVFDLKNIILSIKFKIIQYRYRVFQNHTGK